MTRVPVRISIVTATYNCASTLVDCLRAVSAQVYANYEHIVIDGASTDRTLSILYEHRGQLTKCLSEPDSGIYDALNKGLRMASGDIVGFLHADDVFAGPKVLEDVAEVFASDPTVSAVYGDLQYVRADNLDQVVRYWRSAPFTHRRLSWGWMPPHPTLYVRRSCYERIGGFSTSYRISADYDSILRLFSVPGFKAVYLPRALVKMRVGGVSNRSLANIALKSREDWHALRSSRVGGPGALLVKNLSKIPQFFSGR